MFQDYLKPIVEEALNKINCDSEINLQFDQPANPEFGDLSTNIAMQLARSMKKAPRIIAQEIINNLSYDKQFIDKIEIAGAGFINFYFSNSFLLHSLNEVIEDDIYFGRQEIGKNKTINVEYVSVNPTGLLHLGHGRNAVIGDSISNIFDWLGYTVIREYYFNNAGNQMQMLAKSIFARYSQIFKGDDFPFPEDGYHGDYIKDIAEEMGEKFGNSLLDNTEQNIAQFRKYGESWCFDKIAKTLARINVKQKVFYNEDSLFKEGKIKKLLDSLKAKDLIYEKDGATWLALTKIGLNDDRVIIKSTGEATYRLPDIAYHREKFERKYDLMIDVFGADHIATIPDVLAALKALDYDTDKVKVIVYQFVTLMENGELVKMSKRSGKSYTLDDLLDEVGADVVRFFLLMRSCSTHLEFDLGLAKEQSEKNPVFYLQYAHARISSIFENLKIKNIELLEKADLTKLGDQVEMNLIKKIILFPEIIRVAADRYEPQIMTEYLREVANCFHIFYHNCRIIGDDFETMQARLKLASAAKNVLKNGLQILGIKAPDKM